MVTRYCQPIGCDLGWLAGTNYQSASFLAPAAQLSAPIGLQDDGTIHGAIATVRSHLAVHVAPYTAQPFKNILLEPAADQQQQIDAPAPEVLTEKPAAPTPVAAQTAPANEARNLIGQSLPVMRLLSATGQVINLDDYTGKPVVLVMLRGFAGLVCPYCIEQTAQLIEHLDEFNERDAQIIIVYPGESATVHTFLQSARMADAESFPFPVALDVNLSLVQALNIEGQLSKPTSIILNSAGKVDWMYVGESRDDRPSYKQLLNVIDQLK